MKKNIVLNIGTKESISILNLAKLIFNFCGRKQNISLNTSKLSGVKKRILDVSKLFSIIDFQPYCLKRGLQKTIEWYIHEHNR